MTYQKVFLVINGDYKVGEMMTQMKRIPLVSATGSTRMGKIVAQEVAARLGKSLLELGGNNAIIITPNADLKVLSWCCIWSCGTCWTKMYFYKKVNIHEVIYEKLKMLL